MRKNRFIPVNVPLISTDSRRNVREAVDTGWVSSSGKFVEEFENDFAKYIGVKYAVAVSSGTAALHVALMSLGVGVGDEVVVPAFTMAATWMSVLYVGAKPVFVDVDPDTFNINPNLIEKKINKRTKAIIPVHIYGHSVDMGPLIKIAKKYKLRVIEDAAEAHGVEYKGKKCGSIGDIGCFSFYGNKLITTGEGGMLVMKDKGLAEKARKFKDLHHSKVRFVHDGIGYNYRMTNLQAALGVGELKHIEEYIEKKQKMAKQYEQLLKNIPGIRLPVTKKYSTNIYWMYAILVDEAEFGLNKNELKSELRNKGVDTRDFFYPPNLQPVLGSVISKSEKFPVSEMLSEKGLYLPSGLALNASEIRYVAKTIESARDKSS